MVTTLLRGGPDHEVDKGLAGNKFTLAVGSTKQGQTLQVQLHPFLSQDRKGGLIVKVQPPKEPADPNLHHVPCDIVLSIDVSASMSSAAPAPAAVPGEKEEFTGLTALDLVKHAAMTIVETLDERDRLGIITFSNDSKIIQELTPMTDENKDTTRKKIKSMNVESLTNLWSGIRDGLELFEADSRGRVPALLVLTDGIPNHRCPPKGYIPKLKTMTPLPATIHTFGFGYNLRSGLLKSIAEVGGGNYSFIPDAGMVGTVFIHAVANLQSTFANNVRLRLTYPSYLQLEEMTGEAVGRQEPVELEGDVPEPLTSLTILLSNIQYGQSRDIYLRYNKTLVITPESIPSEIEEHGPPVITAVLEYQRFTPTVHQTAAHQDPFSFPSSLPPAEIAYHMSRAALVEFLSTIYPLNPQLEHEPLVQTRRPEDLPERLQSLVFALPASRPEFATSHPGCRALLIDICGNLSFANPSPSASMLPSAWTGQVALALVDNGHYHRWGVHYLPSLAGAHARQVCGSFKDAGPLLYGADSQLFQRCRDRLDDAFDNLPPPEPSPQPRYGRSSLPRGAGATRGTPPPPVSMRRYRDVNSGCFAAETGVLLAAGKVVRIEALRRGMKVTTPRGPRKVVRVLKMPVSGMEMCVVRDGESGQRLLVTPWHPVAVPQEGASAWQFPREVAQRSVRYTGAVYSVLLERDEDVEAHAILVGGVWGVTMGHGLTVEGKQRDVRAHQFYGNYAKISRALARLPKRAGGVVTGGGLTRDPVTGLVNGFSSPRAGQTQRFAMKGRRNAVSLYGSAGASCLY
ncbi:hint-domain-containing protein [Corynascus similis CBS 632.67]